MATLAASGSAAAAGAGAGAGGWKLEHKIAAAGVGGLAAMGLFKLLDHTFLISQDVKVNVFCVWPMFS